MRYILLLAYFSSTLCQNYSYVPSPSPLIVKPYEINKKAIVLTKAKAKIINISSSLAAAPSSLAAAPSSLATPAPQTAPSGESTKDKYNLRAIILILIAIALWCARFYIYRYFRKTVLKLNKDQERYNIRSSWDKRHELYAIDLKRQDLWSLQATTYRRHGLNSAGSLSPV